MMRSRLGFKRGVSLMELVMVSAIIGIVGMVSKTTIEIINGFARQRSIIEAQHQAQVTLYLITKDMRNARAIINVDPTTNTLVLRMQPTYLGYDTNINPNLFDPTKTGTVTYQYIEDTTGRYIYRQAHYPGTGNDANMKLMLNLLKPPDTVTPMFSPSALGSLPTSLDPYFHAVKVVIQLQAPIAGDLKRTYETEIVKRGSAA